MTVPASAASDGVTPPVARIRGTDTERFLEAIQYVREDGHC
ncbi:hypothetical protein [Halorientalis sp.]|nr:hypothetical protein [Halorientalis sp.]